MRFARPLVSHHPPNLVLVSPTTLYLHVCWPRHSVARELATIKACKGHALVGGLVSSIFRQIVSGINHIHSSGYFHCDMKPENVLVTTTGLFDYTSGWEKVSWGMRQKRHRKWTEWVEPPEMGSWIGTEMVGEGTRQMKDRRHLENISCALSHSPPSRTVEMNVLCVTDIPSHVYNEFSIYSTWFIFTANLSRSHQQGHHGKVVTHGILYVSPVMFRHVTVLKAVPHSFL